MNKFSLRFPQKLEEAYAQFNFNDTLMHFKIHQPVLIIITLTVSILQLQQQYFSNGIACSIATIIFIIQIPIALKTKKNQYICNIFMLNNFIFTALQLFVDYNALKSANLYTSGCLITIINILLLEHYDFVWNSFTLASLVSFRVAFISAYLSFSYLTILYILGSLSLLIIMYQKTYFKRTFFLQREYEKETRSIFDNAVQDTYIHFKFNDQTFKFELTYANSLTRTKFGLATQQDFDDFLSSYFLQEENQKNQKRNSKELISLKQRLYETIVSNFKEQNQKLQFQIQDIHNFHQFMIECYSFQLLHTNVILILKFGNIHTEQENKTNLKEQEIKLLLNQFYKINQRTKKQLSQLIQYLTQSNVNGRIIISENSIHQQIVSNLKTQIILDAINVYHDKRGSHEGCDTFLIFSLIKESIIQINSLAIIERKSIEFDQESSFDSEITQKEWLVKFIIQSLLFLFIAQKGHKKIIVQISQGDNSTQIQIKFFIEGLSTMNFLQQNTFIMQMIYKGLHIIGPKPEIATETDLLDATFNKSELSIKIYKDLEDVFKLIG